MLRKYINKALLFIFVVLLIFACSENSGSTTAVIMKGELQQTIVESGELDAVVTKDFIMPRFGRRWYRSKIITLLEHGEKVEAGDTIFQIDPDDILKFIIERETELANQQAALNKMLVQKEITRNSNKATLESAQADFDLKRLEQKLYEFESETSRKIKELEFKKAEIRLERTKSKIKLNEIIERNDLRIQQLMVSQHMADVKVGYDVLPELTFTTPIPGIFQRARKRRSSSRVNIGDEIYYGTQIANVPDLTWMKVVTKVNEADYYKVKKGQRVLIRLDALPTVAFEGEISWINNICRREDPESRQKIFDLEVKCLDSDERLKPGMTVSCEFICADLKDVFYVPNDCLLSLNNKKYIFLKNGTEITKTPVQIGIQNNHYTQLIGDFKKGQKLVSVNDLNPTEKTE